jgi:hypothetical protein
MGKELISEISFAAFTLFNTEEDVFLLVDECYEDFSTAITFNKPAHYFTRSRTSFQLEAPLLLTNLIIMVYPSSELASTANGRSG